MAESTPSTKSDRHCTCCLKFFPSGTAKICGKCHRRAYCSRDCQQLDWKPKAGGQGHKNWCDLPCGEEDINWEVKSVEGKGLGIIAKRPIPAKYRIMVDGLRFWNHHGIKDLAPIGGSLKEKIEFNVVEYSESQMGLFLRIARLNHACDANSSHICDSTREVKSLIADRDIQAGEEITVSYTCFNDVLSPVSPSPSAGREVLETKWGIVCKDDCFCRDEDIGSLIKECKEYNRVVPDAYSMGYLDDAMATVRKLVENQDKIHSTILTKHLILFNAFHVGRVLPSTFDEAVEYLRRSYEFGSAILHPKSKELLKVKQYVDDPHRD